MKYSILVTAPPYDHEGSRQALTFCHQLLEDGHELSQVFFYQAGIYNAVASMAPPSDELNVYSAWKDLQQQSQAHLRVCITAGEKRGINDTVIEAPFEQTGMGEFFTALHESDRLVQF